MSYCLASVKYIFISKIRSIGYGLVKCTGLLLDFTNLLCILNAFVHKSEVQLRTVLTAWLIEPVLRGEDFDRVSAKNIRP